MKITKYFQKYKNTILLISIFILCLPAIFPLFNSGFFVTDDGEWMIIRFSGFYQALADGQFPVRFLHRLNFDYGYPVATFLYPGFMYFGIPFHVLKIGLVDTIKIILGLSLVGTTIFTYLWLDKFFKNKTAAIIGGLISLYIPYHLYDVYVRGSVGEVFALLWIPFILWMIEKRNIFFTSIGITLLIISHNTLAALFLPLIVLYAAVKVINAKDKRVLIYRYTCILIAGVGMAAFFTIPAIFELPFTNFSQTVISDPTNYLAEYFLIGHSTLIIFLSSLVLFIRQKKPKDNHKTLTILFLTITFIAYFLSSTHSDFLWKFIPSSFIQFPFRLLSYHIISIAFLGAFIVSNINNLTKKIVVTIGIIIITFISANQFIQPKAYFDKGSGFYSTNDATTTVRDEYMPVWVKDKPLQRAEKKVEIINGEAEIKNIFYNNKIITFNIDAKENSKLRINTIYWVGWNVFVNNKKVEFSYNNPKGLIEFDVAKGEHQVKAKFGETPLRVISDLISILSFLFLLSYVFYYKIKDQKSNRKT